MSMNIIHKVGSAGIITVGTYSTSSDPIYGNYYASPDIEVGIVTATSFIGGNLIAGITTVGLGSTSTPPSNSQLSFELTSNTNLRVKVRGSDGVIRTANITLS